MSLSFYAASVLVCIAVILLFVVLYLKGRIRLLQCSIEALEKEKDEYAAQAARLSAASQIANGNRRDADEKIGGLYKGDAVGNALDLLRNDKN